MKISPALMIAIVGAAAVFFYMQRRAQAGTMAAPSTALQPGGVPPGWVERTPQGFTVPGTTGRLYDILT